MTVSRADRAESAPINRPPSIDRMAAWPELAPLIERAAIEPYHAGLRRPDADQRLG